VIKLKNLITKSVDEAITPKGWNTTKKFIKVLDREIKNLKKYHNQQNDEDFLEVVDYMQLQLDMIKKNISESVNEDLDPYKDFGTKNSWEKNYDLNLGAFVDEYQKFMKAVKKLKPIKDESKRAWANAIREKVGQGMFNGYIGMWMKPIEVLEENQKFEKLKDKDGWTYNESINEDLSYMLSKQRGHISDHHPARAFGPRKVKEVASPLVDTLTHAIADVDKLIDVVYSDEADDAFKDPKMSKKLLMAVEKLLKKVR